MKSSSSCRTGLWTTRYSFTASQPVKGLRPLRDPDAADLDDDDDGQEE
ncbi:hypothetical protein [Streptomyces sp. SP18BB07]|nr:hypothetical protein [Streptomyces sp. SP18BB07]MEE1757968.1 hypothetical protein [Streptomyces sp. SP18BB07]